MLKPGRPIAKKPVQGARRKPRVRQAVPAGRVHPQEPPSAIYSLKFRVSRKPEEAPGEVSQAVQWSRQRVSQHGSFFASTVLQGQNTIQGEKTIRGIPFVCGVAELLWRVDSLRPECPATFCETSSLTGEAGNRWAYVLPAQQARKLAPEDTRGAGGQLENRTAPVPGT